MQRAEVLLNDYNYYRAFTTSIRSKRAAGKYIVSVGRTPATRPRYLTAFARMATWCDSKGVDPRRWLHSLFLARRWTFAPPLSHLTSKKHLPRYASMTGSMPVYRQRVAEEQRVLDEQEGRIFNASRDISYTAETLKAVYLRRGFHGRCMELMETETFGYHPKSTVCAACPIAVACEAMLRSKMSYDIQAVRRGEVTPQQIQTMEAYRG